MEQLDMTTTPIAEDRNRNEEAHEQEPTTDRRRRLIVGCALSALGVLLVALLSVCGGLWWTVSTVTESVTVYPTMEPLRLDGAGVVFPAQPRMKPTPVIPATNLEGGIRHAEIPSASLFDASSNAITDRPLQPYTPYAAWAGWENSTAAKSRYLAGVNLTGARRTPYTKGQRLMYPGGQTYTVKTADFDFTLLVDASGAEWYCGPSVNTLQDLQSCYRWR